MAYQGAGLLIATRTEKGWEVLLGKRRRTPFRGYWSIPGGKHEMNDSCFQDTACRETAEEICDHKPVEEYFRDCLKDDFDRSQMPAHRHLIPFLSEWHTFLLVLSERVPPGRFSVPNYEFSTIDWFPLKRPPNPTHPGVLLSARGRHFGLSDPRPLFIYEPLATLRMASILAQERLLGSGSDQRDT